jgi:hypothetical protein
MAGLLTSYIYFLTKILLSKLSVSRLSHVRFINVTLQMYNSKNIIY